MYILRPDEKTTPVMLYSHGSLVRGDLVTKQNVLRVNIWPRSDGVPRYMHVLKAQMLIFGGGPARALSYSQLYFPTSRLIAFHTLPPSEEPLDYEPGESNRTLEEVDVLVGTFSMNGKVRISTQTEVGVSLEMAVVSWLSLYDAEITNPSLSQMPPLHVPMVLVSPNQVAFGLA